MSDNQIITVKDEHDGYDLLAENESKRWSSWQFTREDLCSGVLLFRFERGFFVVERRMMQFSFNVHGFYFVFRGVRSEVLCRSGDIGEAVRVFNLALGEEMFFKGI